MPFADLTTEEWPRLFRRTLIHGWPNSWKTTSIFLDSDHKPDKAWPRPIGYVAFPGEQGTASIRPGMDGVASRIWKVDPNKPSEPIVDYAAVKNETRTLLTRTPRIATFAGDGLTKLYDLIYAAKLTELLNLYGDKVDEDKLRGRAYGLAHKEFLDYLKLVCSSDVTYVVFTCWSSMEKDDPESKKTLSHVWPNLPGDMRQQVLGEFGSVLYAEPGIELGAGKFDKGKWQTRPFGKVYGVGIKVPVEIAARIPTHVDQNWKTLEGLVLRGKQQEEESK